jgi:hypothetical protein
MSITIFLANHQGVYKMPNSSYNPTEPKDPIYNPIEIDIDIYPSLNMSNINGTYFLKAIDMFNETYAGIISRDSNNSFVELLQKLKDLKSIRPDYHNYCNKLEIIIAHAIALHDDVVWN